MKPKSLVLRLFDHTESLGERQAERVSRYHRQVDCSDRSDRHETTAPNDTPRPQVEDGGRKKEKCASEIHFAFLPERYEPLVEEDEGRQRAKEEKKNKKKQKYKKVKKNVGKALRYSWKCLMLGLHSMAAGYSTPLTAAATLVPEFHAGRDRG
ncbi:unnamed protein product [Coregonus sp. 'balchen']|uniref:Uncharacterized protein n=1 Tax=Coregonus suidteri TaxID=861788 RepID=A0AAN8L2N8_9TELE|nr:uncharacterized protein C1orf115 homolog [Coregonus clupeaformis]CAB1340103.1 unnamed protein product [Coregonus sp. 'balchen']